MGNITTINGKRYLHFTDELCCDLVSVIKRYAGIEADYSLFVGDTGDMLCITYANNQLCWKLGTGERSLTIYEWKVPNKWCGVYTAALKLLQSYVKKLHCKIILKDNIAKELHLWCMGSGFRQLGKTSDYYWK